MGGGGKHTQHGELMNLTSFLKEGKLATKEGICSLAMYLS
jgi:hypothetical protein